MNFLLKSYPWALPITVSLGMAKRTFELKTYLQLLPLTWGLLEIVRSKFRLYSIFWPLLLMASLNFIPAFTISEVRMTSIFLIQLILMIFFSQFVARHFDRKFFEKLCWSVLAINTLQMTLQFVTQTGTWERRILGTTFTRLGGIVGEPNYTCALLIGLLAIAIFFNLNRIGFLLALSTLPTLSRAGVLSICLLLLLLLLRRYAPKAIILFSISILSLFTLLPILLLFLNHYGTDEQIHLLSQLSQRFFLFRAYIDMGSDHFFLGTGFKNSVNLVPAYLEFANEILGRPAKISEQHNLFLQVFSDFGATGLILYMIFLFQVAQRALSISPELLALFSITLFSFFFLNGMSELVIYIFVGAILSMNADFKRWVNSSKV